MQSIKVKVLTVFMSFMMAISVLPALNSNAAVKKSWNNLGDGLKYELSDDGVLSVTGKGDMVDFVGTDTTNDGKADTSTAPWFDIRNQIKKIVIGDGITKVGNYAFIKCWNLAEIEFKSTGSLKTIGTQAFLWANSSKHTKLVIPSGVVTIGSNAFAWNYYITSVSIPNTVKTIGYGAFSYCNALTSVYIPASVTTIGGSAFRDCFYLKSVTGGAGLTSIEDSAFMYCSRMKTFKITSKKLAKLGKKCFYCCNALKTIYIKQTTKLKKKKVKKSLYFSSVKTVKVKKSKVKKYKKFFTYKNCGRRGVRVKK